IFEASGHPHCGQASALVETCRPHSGQGTRAIKSPLGVKPFLRILPTALREMESGPCDYPPSKMLHNLAVLSWLPVANSWPSGLNATESTLLSCPSRVSSNLPSGMDQIRAV